MQYYLRKTYLKTASLISKSCRAGTILGGGSTDCVEAAYQYGKKSWSRNSKIVDDMLEYTASAATSGKPSNQILLFTEGAPGYSGSLRLYCPLFCPIRAFLLCLSAVDQECATNLIVVFLSIPVKVPLLICQCLKVLFLGADLWAVTDYTDPVSFPWSATPRLCIVKRRLHPIVERIRGSLKSAWSIELIISNTGCSMLNLIG